YVPRPKQRTDELRARVLQVAMTTLADEGVAGLTTRKVASEADTSTPAVYELFGDKSGLVREAFFGGVRDLANRLRAVPVTYNPRADITRVVDTVRAFAREKPVLADVMFSRPFADFDPGPDEAAAGRAARELIVGRVQRAIDAGVLSG